MIEGSGFHSVTEFAVYVLRDLVSHHGRGIDPTGVLTISAGVAAYTPGDPTTLDELLERADAALYRAKSAGRNRVAMFEDDLKAAG